MLLIGLIGSLEIYESRGYNITTNVRSLASLVRSYSSLRSLNGALGPSGHRAL